jgi:hypothetical protein
MRIVYKLCLLIFISIQLSAQSQEGVYVKYKFTKRNGGQISHIIGEIVEKTANGPYKVKLDNGAVIELNERDYVSIKPVRVDSRTGLQYVYAPPTYKWGFSTELMGVSNGIRNLGTPKYSTGVGIGAHRYISPLVSFGAGVGMYNYDIDSRRMLFPFYGEGKVRFIRNSSTPVLGMKAGYGVAAKNYIAGLQDKQGGMFYNPYFGYELGTTNKVSWTLGIGVLLQKAYYTYENGTTFADENILFRRTEFKLGIEFH